MQEDLVSVLVGIFEEEAVSYSLLAARGTPRI
jgi:hypothetical protein